MTELPNIAPRDQSPTARWKANILLVDDNPANLLSLRVVLDELGENLVDAISGEEALRLVRRDDFAVVLLDVLMPGIDGFETAKLIRQIERSRRTPIIFLTAGDLDRETLEKGYELGAVDFLVKPLLPVVLRAKVLGFAELFREKQQAKREAEQLRWLVDGTSDYAIFMLDAEGRVATWNRGAERLKGYTAGEIIGQHFSRFYPADAKDWPLHELNVAKAEGRFEDEGWRQRKDGSRFWANVIITAVRDERGHLRGFSKVTRDLTKRRESEDALRRSEERFRLLVEGAEDYAIFLLDTEGCVASWNLGAQRIKGYSAEEIIGQHFSRFYPEDAIDRGWPEYEIQMAESEGRFEDEGWRIRKDGARFWANVVITALRDENGNLRGFSKITRDMTERKKSEENARRLIEETTARRVSEENAKLIQEQRERLHVTLESIGDAVISTDAAGLVTFLNPVARELVGWNVSEAVGRPLPEVFHIVNDETRQPVENPALRALREGLIVGLANHTILISKTGQERSIDDSGAPIRNGDGNVIGSILVFRDISEQKRGDERLRESERQLADFFENATIGLHWVGPDGIIIRVNKTELEMLGYEREEYVGRSITEFHADQEVICEILQRLGAGENLREYPARLKCKNGSIKEVLIDSSVMWKDGEFVHTRCFTRDVTERNRAEVARAEAERRLNAVFNQQFQFMVILAADGTVIDANEMCFTATGYMRTDIIGQVFWKTPWWNGLPDMPMKWQVFVADALRGAAPRTAEMQYARSDGTIRLATTIVSGLKNDEGKVVNVIIEGRDDTARKRQEAELRESEEKLRLLADTIPQLAWMAQPDGYISWYNRRWYEYTGKSREEMEGWGWQSVHDPEVLPTVLERWRESLATGEPFDMIYPLRDRDGELRPFLTRVNPLRDPNGRIIYWFGTSTDISDIKRMEEALRDADRRKDEFLATLAHELRNPLAPIRNSLQILKMPRVDPEMVLQTRDIMERQVHHLVRLVDDLLDVSRVMRGKIELRREPIELATVIARAVETANPLIEVQGHELEISVPKESLLVNVDPVRLAQVIGNLLTNSAKYMDSNGHIWLSASKEGEHAVLTVRDTGIGISLELLPHVFELFVQADHTSTKAQGGLGIGLTLVKNLVQMHGGSVRAESAGVGKGSEFTIVLPLIHGEMSAASEEGSASHSTEPTASGLRIIVVDDNRDAAVSLSMLLRLQGHDVRVNHDGQSALDVAANYLPDVVFLDLGMPKMDGFGVAERIRTLTGLKNVVLVALTGWGQQQDRKRTAEAGFNYHLVKPPEPTEIESLLGDLVRSGSQRQS